jgi:hypothetical protein
MPLCSCEPLMNLFKKKNDITGRIAQNPLAYNSGKTALKKITKKTEHSSARSSPANINTHTTMPVFW